MSKQEDFFLDLLADFAVEARRIMSYKIMAGDAEKPFAHIAVLALRSLDAYKHWLRDPHSDIGGRTPLVALQENPESNQVKRILLIRILEREGYLSPLFSDETLSTESPSHPVNIAKD